MTEKKSNEKELTETEIILSDRIAQRLRQLREEKEDDLGRPLSQDGLCSAIESRYLQDGFTLSRASIQNYEAAPIDRFGGRHPKAGKNLGMSAEAVHFLSDFFNVSADYLTGNESEARSIDKGIAGAAQTTALSEKAIQILSKKKEETHFNADLLSFIIETSIFERICHALHAASKYRSIWESTPEPLYTTPDNITPVIPSGMTVIPASDAADLYFEYAVDYFRDAIREFVDSWNFTEEKEEEVNNGNLDSSTW